MKKEKIELTDELDQVSGGSGISTDNNPGGIASNPFKDIPRIDTNPYDDDVKRRI